MVLDSVTVVVVEGVRVATRTTPHDTLPTRVHPGVLRGHTSPDTRRWDKADEAETPPRVRTVSGLNLRPTGTRGCLDPHSRGVRRCSVLLTAFKGPGGRLKTRGLGRHGGRTDNPHRTRVERPDKGSRLGKDVILIRTDRTKGPERPRAHLI